MSDCGEVCKQPIETQGHANAYSLVLGRQRPGLRIASLNDFLQLTYALLGELIVDDGAPDAITRDLRPWSLALHIDRAILLIHAHPGTAALSVRVVGQRCAFVADVPSLVAGIVRLPQHQPIPGSIHSFVGALLLNDGGASVGVGLALDLERCPVADADPVRPADILYAEYAVSGAGVYIIGVPLFAPVVGWAACSVGEFLILSVPRLLLGTGVDVGDVGWHTALSSGGESWLRWLLAKAKSLA